MRVTPLVTIREVTDVTMQPLFDKWLVRAI
jgi:hypothetical protein